MSLDAVAVTGNTRHQSVTSTRSRPSAASNFVQSGALRSIAANLASQRPLSTFYLSPPPSIVFFFFVSINIHSFLSLTPTLCFVLGNVVPTHSAARTRTFNSVSAPSAGIQQRPPCSHSDERQIRRRLRRICLGFVPHPLFQSSILKASHGPQTSSTPLSSLQQVKYQMFPYHPFKLKLKAKLKLKLSPP